jgi:hypothetical protein
MYTAMIMACLATVPDSCITFVDELGPYETEKLCVIRTQEMAQSAANIAGQPVLVKRNCIKDKGVAL